MAVWISAWGEPDEASDVDLFVIIPENETKSVLLAQRGHRCLRGLGVAKDVIVKTRSEVDRFRNIPSSIENEIIKHGRLIYGVGEG